MGDVDEDSLAELALRLRTLRAQRGLQMGGLQQRTGLGRTTVSQALNGQAVPSETTLVALAKALSTDVEPLLALREAAVRIRQVQDSSGEAAHGRDDGPSDAAEDERDADADRALATYARRVRETYGSLDLEVLTPDNDQSTQPSVELREVFVVPTVRADPPPVELSRELMGQLLKGEELAAGGELPPGLDLELLDSLVEAYRQQPAEHVLDVLAREKGQRVVLLGDPGAGKSTLAHYLALALTGGLGPGGALAGLAGRIPLIVELRHYAQPAWRQQTFAEFLAHLWTTEGMGLPLPVLGRLLDEGRVLLVFDGLDEIFDPKFRAETARRIAGFAAHHQRCRVIVTSRVIGYQRQTLDGAGFAHYMIQDLDTPRIHEFARRWYETACPGQPALTEPLLTRFKDAVAHSRSVRELAGNPLLLTILAILGRRQTLPRDRHGVYQHAVTVLVARWDRDAKHLTAPLSEPVTEALDLLSQTERLEMLRLLARRMQEGSNTVFTKFHRAWRPGRSKAVVPVVGVVELLAKRLQGAAQHMPRICRRSRNGRPQHSWKHANSATVVARSAAPGAGSAGRHIRHVRSRLSATVCRRHARRPWGEHGRGCLTPASTKRPPRGIEWLRWGPEVAASGGPTGG